MPEKALTLLSSIKSVKGFGLVRIKALSNLGINTVGQSLRNANLQLRSEPPNPQVSVSPWMNSSIGPDLLRRPLEVGDSCGSAASPSE